VGSDSRIIDLSLTSLAEKDSSPGAQFVFKGFVDRVVLVENMTKIKAKVCFQHLIAGVNTDHISLLHTFKDDNRYLSLDDALKHSNHSIL